MIQFISESLWTILVVDLWNLQSLKSTGSTDPLSFARSVSGISANDHGFLRSGHGLN